MIGVNTNYVLDTNSLIMSLSSRTLDFPKVDVIDIDEFLKILLSEVN